MRSYNEYSSTRGYCNSTKPVPIVNPVTLQIVVDNDDSLQGAHPTEGQTMGFDGTNVVWGDFGGGTTPSLQQVMNVGSTATVSTPIELKTTGAINIEAGSFASLKSSTALDITSTAGDINLKANGTGKKVTVEANDDISLTSTSGDIVLTTLSGKTIVNSAGSNEINFVTNGSNSAIQIITSSATNNINQFGYTTKEKNDNATYYINFSTNATDGISPICKTSGISCNPSDNSITATTFIGNLTGGATTVETTSDNTNGQYFIPFSKAAASATTQLYLDDSTNFTYNPFTTTITASDGTNTDTISPTVITLSDGVSTTNDIRAQNIILSDGVNTDTISPATITLTDTVSTNTVSAPNITLTDGSNTIAIDLATGKINTTDGAGYIGELGANYTSYTRPAGLNPLQTLQITDERVHYTAGVNSGLSATWPDIISNVGSTSNYNDVLGAGNTANEKSAIIEGTGSIGNSSTTIDKDSITILDTDNASPIEAKKQNDITNQSFQFSSQVTAGYNDSLLIQLANNGAGGSSGITHTDNFPTPSSFIINTNQDLALSSDKNLTITSDNINLSSGGRLQVTNNTGETLDYNPAATNLLTLSTDSLGGTNNPMFTLNHTGGVGSATMKFYRNSSNSGNAVGEIIFNGNTTTTTNQEYARIAGTIRSNTVGNLDGSISLNARVNNINTEFIRVNGGDDQTEFLRPIDMNGQNINTSTGDLILNAAGSTTTGNVNISAKTGANINLNSNVLMDGGENISIRNAGNTIYNNSTQSGVSMVDTTTPLNSKQHILTNTLQSIINQQATTFTNESDADLTSIRESDNSTGLDIKRLSLTNNAMVIVDNTNPSSTEQLDINATSLQFTSSGSASDSLSMYNDSADGGEIDWSNVSGTNGLTITSSHSLTLKSTTATYPIELDSDVINLKNTNTTTATPNHTALIVTTSNNVNTSTFLKLQLNGADIWIPYWTTDPSA
jgi:hypothetical protein